MNFIVFTAHFTIPHGHRFSHLLLRWRPMLARSLKVNIMSSPVSIWMGDRQGRPSAVNLRPFVGVDFNLRPTVIVLPYINQSISHILCVPSFIRKTMKTSERNVPSMLRMSCTRRKPMFASLDVEIVLHCVLIKQLTTTVDALLYPIPRRVTTETTRKHHPRILN